MADQRHQQRSTDAMKAGMFSGQKGQAQGPPTSKVLAVVTLVPAAGFLRLLSGLTLAATLIGLAVSTLLFVMCSPILVPAAAVIGLVMTGFLASGAFSITGISSLSWIANYLRRARLPEQLEHTKRRAQETEGQMGQTVTGKAQETAGRAQEAAGRG